MNAQRVIEQRILAQSRLVAERLASNPSVLGHARANLARWGTKYDGDEVPAWVSEWQELLDSPIENVLEVLTADTEQARWLRSCSPFAGVLSPKERWLALKGADRAP